MRRPNNRAKTYRSVTADVSVRGTASQIAAKYTELAYEAQSEKDNVTAERFRQAAHHWNGIKESENHATE